MSKEKMLEAKKLIQEKDYEAARAILETVDHPTARKWEAKLNQIIAQSSGKKPQGKRSRGGARGRVSSRVFLAGVAGIVLIVVVVVVLLIASQPGGQTTPEAENQTSEQATVASGDEDNSPSGDNPTPDNNPVPSEDERPGSLPEDFPFPGGGFTPVFDLSDSEEISVSVYSSLSSAELEAFYREAIPAAGYELFDFSAGDAVILSFRNQDMQGNVRVTQDGPNGEARLTIEMGERERESELIGASFSDPVAATEAFIGAIYTPDFEGALEIVCDELRPEFSDSVLRAFGPSIPGGVIDPSSIEYTLLNQSGDSAEVGMSGQVNVHIAATDTDMSIDFPELTLQLRDENGWKICPA